MKIYCIHHNDNDGLCSAAIVKRMYKDDEIFFKSYNYNYDNDFIDFIAEAIVEADIIYIVDISLNGLDEYFGSIINSDKTVWIDHHATSIALEKKNPNLKKIKGFRSVKWSGAYLTYLWFIKNTMPSTMEHCGTDIETGDYDKIIPYVVKLVDDHDRFIHKYHESIDFLNGSQLYEGHDDPTSVFWDAVLGADTLVLDDAICRGNDITKYNHNRNEDIVKKAGTIRIVEEDKATGTSHVYEGLGINYISNSLIFGDKFSSITFGLVYHYDASQSMWKYSIYSSDSDFSCNSIAEFFGGGGHKGAAGFSTKELVIKNGTIHITK